MIGSWLLLVLYAALGIANVARGILAFAVHPVLADTTSWPFWLLGVVYLAWGLALLACGIVALRRLDRARWLIRAGAIAYQATVWLIHVFGDVSTHARRLWLRDLLLSLLFLAVVFVLTSLPARGTKRRSR
ncbi:MAG: hypothetical protein JXC32_20380 [Anaerolineae bacterium]|nr:hypothetical protein [Anaerolineae bacterium]